MNKYTLDQDIIVDVNWSNAVQNATKPYMATYEIYPYERNSYNIPIDGSYDNNPIFIGSAFVPAGETSLQLHLNEILEAQRWTPDFLSKNLSDGKVKDTGSGTPLITNNWYNKYKVVITDLPVYDGLKYSTTFDSMLWETTDGLWTCGAKGYSHTNDGVQITSSLSGAYTTSTESFANVTKVVVTYCTNTSSGTGSVQMTIGDTSMTQNVTREGGKTKRELVYDFSLSQPTGIVKLLVNCSVNSIYIAGITIHYKAAASDSTITYAEKEVCVGLWYNYPNKPLTQEMYAIPDWDSQDAILTNCLDGQTDTGAILLPHIPFAMSDQIGFGMVFQPTRTFIATETIPTSGKRYITLGFEHMNYNPIIQFDISYPQINYFYRPLKELFQDVYLNPLYADEQKTLKVVSKSKNKTIAIVDDCPAKYYLQWVDRTGGIQCQPFNGTATYSEDFTRVQIQNSIGYKRDVNVQASSKWELHTDWIEESLYPYYESIYLSPFLLLYDTENDKSYNVLVTDKAYTEKTRKNQKKLINMTIKLTSSKNQNMYY